METKEAAECPFCLQRMHLEAMNGGLWLVCDNGCGTEAEVLPRKTPAAEEPLRAKAAIAGK